MPTPTLVSAATSAISSSTSYTCNKPTLVAAGHFLLALQWSIGTIGAVPAGWAQLKTLTAGATSRLAYLPAGGSEPGTYTFVQTASAGGAIIVPVAGTSLAGLVSATANAASGNAVTTPSVVPFGAADLEVRFVVSPNADSGFNTPAGFTEQADADQFSISGACATRVLASGSATGIQNFATTNGLTPGAPHGYTVTLTELVASVRRSMLGGFSQAVHHAANF